MRIAPQYRAAEIDQPESALGKGLDADILRFDVAVGDAGAVQKFERDEHLRRRAGVVRGVWCEKRGCGRGAYRVSRNVYAWSARACAAMAFMTSGATFDVPLSGGGVGGPASADLSAIGGPRTPR